MSERFVAMLALERHVSLDPIKLAQQLKRSWPQFASMVGDPPKQETGESFVLPFGNNMIIGMQMPFPIPRETFQPALDNEKFWPQAATEFARHKAHVVLSVLSPTDDDLRLIRDRAEDLTLAAAAFCEMAPVCGVFLSTADMVIEPKRFVEQAHNLGPSSLPVDLWVTFRFFPGPTFSQDNAVVVRTNGLRAFVGREVECGPYALPPGALAQNVLTIATYILQNHVTFADGATVGASDRPTGQIRTERSRYDGEMTPVYRLLLAEPQYH
jgi:Domain of unknown function (DUF4261)